MVHMSHGLVSVVLFSWGNNLSVNMVVANNVHRGSYGVSQDVYWRAARLHMRPWLRKRTPSSGHRQFCPRTSHETRPAKRGPSMMKRSCAGRCEAALKLGYRRAEQVPATTSGRAAALHLGAMIESSRLIVRPGKDFREASHVLEQASSCWELARCLRFSQVLHLWVPVTLAP